MNKISRNIIRIVSLLVLTLLAFHTWARFVLSALNSNEIDVDKNKNERITLDEPLERADIESGTEHISVDFHKESVIKQKPMNVLFLVADDLRPQLNSYKGTFNPNPHNNYEMYSPNLDALAKRSLQMNRAYVQFSVCGPSRASYMTGRRPDTTRVWDLKTNWRKSGGNFTTIPQHFKNHGYRTAGMGKIYHPGCCGPENDELSWTEPYLRTKPFLQYDDRKTSWWAVPENISSEHPLHDEQITTAAVEYMQNHIKNNNINQQPFFLAVGFMKPHIPHVAPERYFEHYPLDEITVCDNQHVPIDFPPVAWFHIEGDNYVNFASYNLTRDYGQHLAILPSKIFRRAYFACVSFIDDMVGRLVKAVHDLGLDQSTIISFIGDHGYHLGENGMWGKHTNLEQATHAPLLLHIPGQTDNGVQSDTIVEFVDLFPTLSEAAGIGTIPTCPKLSNHLELCAEGSSFLDLVKKSDSRPESEAVSQIARSQIMGYTLRTNRYRYVEWPNVRRNITNGSVVRNGILWENVAENGRELYDHSTDPEENINIVNRVEHTEVVSALSKTLRDAVADGYISDSFV